MAERLPQVVTVRHGQTAWSLSGRHTGRSDIPLTAQGESDARALGAALASRPFTTVLTSPLLRARATCALAGFAERAIVDPDLVEWDYGAYEGKRRAEIELEAPGWRLFRDGCPQGESVAQIGARADRVCSRVRQLTGDTLLFSSGHMLRILAARWMGLAASTGACLVLDTASISVLGYEHALDNPCLVAWNQSASGLRSA